jgi:putative ABC transport system permease protein
MDSARSDIIEIVKNRHQGIEDFTVITQDAILATFDSIFGVVTAALAGIASISLVVAGVLIMNVMLVAVTQRTSEIGLFKALGANRRQIMLLFLAEASFLAMLGGVIGFAVGQGASLALRTVYPIIDFHAPLWASLSGLAVAIVSGLSSASCRRVGGTPDSVEASEVAAAAEPIRLTLQSIIAHACAARSRRSASASASRPSCC